MAPPHREGQAHATLRRERRVVKIARRPTSARPSLVDRVATLLDRYVRARKAAVAASGAPCPDFLFQLPDEPRRPLTRTMNDWLEASLDRVGVVAPPGFAYKGHSIRSMACSAMAAIGVARHKYVWLCGWARGSTVVDRHYLDPTFEATPAAHDLYGWLLDGRLSAGDLELDTRPLLYDPRELDRDEQEAAAAASDAD